MDDYLKNMAPAVRERNRDKLEPKVAETLRGRKGRPEGELQDEVIQALQVRGYHVAHFRSVQTPQGWQTPVQADGGGFPDLIAVRTNPAPHLLVIELKSEAGTLSDDQKIWLQMFSRVPGVQVMLLRPSSWRDVEKWLL
jgi:hypothetical protein